MDEADNSTLGSRRFRPRGTASPSIFPRIPGDREEVPGSTGSVRAHNGFMNLRVLIADDHPVVRGGLRALIETLEGLEVAGEAGDGETAVREAQLLRPDVVLMDVRMPGIDGVEATRRIRAAVPETAVLILTMYDDDATVFTAMQAGARGYLLKGAGQEEIVAAIRAVVTGQATSDPAWRHAYWATSLHHPHHGPPPSRSSPRASARFSTCSRPEDVRRRSPRRCSSPPRRSATT